MADPGESQARAARAERADPALQAVGSSADAARSAERAEAVDATVTGVVERGVDTAYTVIDEYMTRGRNAAGRWSQWTDGRNEMSASSTVLDTLGELGPDGPVVAADANVGRRHVRFRARRTGPGNCVAQRLRTRRHRLVTAQAPRVEVRVSSKPTAVVTVSLDPGADSMQLTAEPLCQHGQREEVLAAGPDARVASRASYE